MEEEYIKITMEEYKELLMIKGRYEELRRMNQPLTFYNGKRDEISILPCKDISKTDITMWKE